MSQDTPTHSPLARWARTVGVFSVQLLLVAIVLHRLMSLPTPVALNLFAAALVGSVAAILLALGAYVAIWRDGRVGTLNASIGMFLGLAIIAWPAGLVPLYRSLPAIHDVTTDPAVPPAFVALAAQRVGGANSADYEGPEVARQQVEAYPDIRPILIARAVNETWEVLQTTIRRLGWRVVSETPPNGRSRPGFIEAVDRTMVLGFTDDIVVRVDGDSRETRIDVRSASRFGEHDFGRNANRIRGLLKELETRLRETVSVQEGPQRRAKAAAAVPKRGRGDPALKPGQQRKQVPGRQGSRREPQPKGTPPGRGEDRARGKQPQRSQQ